LHHALLELGGVEISPSSPTVLAAAPTASPPAATILAAAILTAASAVVRLREYGHGQHTDQQCREYKTEPL
jgi:hypothetical protein